MKKLLLTTMLMLSPIVASASDISPISQSYYNKAISLYNANNVSQAKSYMLKVIDKEPNFADAHFNLGVMYKNAQIYEKAVKYFQRAIDLNNNDYEAKFYIAVCLNELQKTDEAVNYLTAIPKGNKNYGNAYKLLAEIAPDKYAKNIKPVNLEQKTNSNIIENNKFQNKIEQQELEIQKQKEKINDLSSRLQQQLSNAHVYQSKINTLENTLKQQAENFTIQAKQIEQQYMNKLTNAHMQGTKEIEYIQILQSKDKELAQKNNLLTQQTNQINQLNSKIKELLSASQGKNAQEIKLLQQKEQELVEKNNLLQQQMGKINQLNAQLKNLHEINQQQINELDELRNRTVSNVQIQDSINVSAFKDEISVLKNQKEELNRMIVQLKEQIKIQENNNSLLVNKIKILESTIQNQANQIAKQTSQVQNQQKAELEIANNNLKQELTSKSALIKMQEEEIAKLKLQISKLQNNIAQQQDAAIKSVAQIIKPVKNEYFGIIHTFAAPTGITRDLNNNTFVASFAENSIYKITPQNKISLFLKHQQINGPIGLACDSKNNIYVANYNNNTIIKIAPNTEIDVFAKDIERPYYLTIVNDILYVSEQASNTVIKYNLND